MAKTKGRPATGPNIAEQTRSLRALRDAERPPSPLGKAHEKTLDLRAWCQALDYVVKAQEDALVRQSFDAMKLLSLLRSVFEEGNPGDWMEVFDRITRTEISAHRAERGHVEKRDACAWVREHYENKRGEFDGKMHFAREYVPLVLDKFEVKVSDRTLAERWLKGL